ncbi:cytosine permease [Gluconacetobacter liquefaciens NRIC 0522]|nr:cytosine permease [Gluconacetobacter liquefaciens NRIC 0522]
MQEMRMHATHDEHTANAVPEAERGSAWRIFFIVAGTQCGLPGFVLSARILSALGLHDGIAAIIASALMTALLAAFTSWLGAATGMSLSLLSTRIFGPYGAVIVRTVIGVSLVGWFGATIGLLGSTAAPALSEQFHLHISPHLVSTLAGIGIVIGTCMGARGLERIGQIVIPVVALGLIAGIARTWHALPAAALHGGTHALTFGGAVSAMIGSYVVGIIIQPDYSRFVRSPNAAAGAVVAALALAYPVIMIASGIPSLALGRPDLVSALVALGFGIPALLVLVLSAWIDASACLYSGSLALANLLQGRRLWPYVLGSGIVGGILELGGLTDAYVRFLLLLGIVLPPIAAILIVDTLIGLPANAGRPAAGRQHAAILAWICGGIAGALSEFGMTSLTTIPTFDGLLVSACIMTVASLYGRLTPSDPAI